MKHHLRTLAIVVVILLSLGATAYAATGQVVGRSAARATVLPAPKAKAEAPTPKRYSCATKGERTTCVGQVTENGKTYTTTIVKVDGDVVSKTTKAKATPAAKPAPAKAAPVKAKPKAKAAPKAGKATRR